MSFQVLAIPTISENASSGTIRSYATYHPTLWEGLSFTYSNSKQKIDNNPTEEEFEGLKEEVRRMLSDGSPNLVLIDAVQRLGVGYHFHDEIKHALDHHSISNNDLYNVALQFRLLRQHGIKVSCDIFQRFKDGEGKFKESLKGDVLGMLSLYEAAHLGIQGEDILDEAIDFTTTNLNLLLPQLSPNLAKQVTRALTRPIRKWLPRLEARHYIDIYESEKSYNSILYKFAKLDFNIIQQLHQQELNGIIEWDAKITDTLPECMKTVFRMLENVYNEIEETITKEGKSYYMDYLKQELNRVIECYLTEANWRDHNYVPRVEEYMRVSKISTCYPLLSTTSLIGMGEIANKNVLEWVYNYPKIVQASATICRLMDDIVSSEYEKKRDHVASGIDCYKKEHGVSEEEVIKLFQKEIINAWKDMNEECLNPTPARKPILEGVLNLTRIMDFLYKEIDAYTNSHVMKDHIHSLFIDPVV